MKQRIGAVWLFALLLFCGCAKEVPAAPPEPQPAPVQTTPAPAQTVPAPPEAEEEPEPVHPPLDIAEEAVTLAELPEPTIGIVLEPEASGTLEARCDDAVIDYSHTEDGYVMVRFTGQTEKRLKVQVQGPTTTYTYNLPRDQWTVFPLSDGNGGYRVVVFQNVSGSQYATVLSAEFSVSLQDEFAPFLRPNQYVDYTDSKRTVDQGAELCSGLTEPLEKVAAVYDYVVDTLHYDYDKAATVTSGYLPVLDTVLQEKKGICFDYAALMTAMLRSQQVPCKLVVGYADAVYHAWISVWTEKDGWVDGVIFFDGSVWKRMDPTFASSGERSQEIMDYIEHGNYQVKYLY